VPRKVVNPNIDVDLQHIANILKRIDSPWRRYQLTMILELYADEFEDGAQAAEPQRRRAAKKPKKKRDRAKKA
jgi:hypothetical protein